MHTQEKESETRVERRYWRRSEAPAPWWPWGLLPLLGLALVLVYGLVGMAPHIESQVAAEVDAHLRANDIAVANVEANGQNVAVLAAVDQGDEPGVRAVARSAKCDTWAGRLPCPANVDVIVEMPARFKPDTPSGQAPLAQQPHDFVFAAADGQVSLRGEIPNDFERQRVVDLASERFGEVVDQLQVTDRRATDQYALAADRALAVLSSLDRGEATWTAGILNARGAAGADDAQAARARFNAGGRNPNLGELVVEELAQTPPAATLADYCNERFQAVLAHSSIRFRTSSTQIDSGNEAILGRLAAIARECSGRLTIAGHTDSRGSAELNQSLSLGRAQSVRDALVELGVDPKRLDARGLGETQPIADNDTAQGRAQNRRIVITVASQN